MVRLELGKQNINAREVAIGYLRSLNKGDYIAFLAGVKKYRQGDELIETEDDRTFREALED